MASATGGLVRYVALPGSTTRTTVAVVRVKGGRIALFSSVPGVVGIPLVAFDGTTGGLSANGRRLVLASTNGAGGSATKSLYARPDGTAFVHALDTLHGTATCIDLPWPDTGTAIWRVRLSVAGGVLRLLQPGVGTLAGIDRQSLRVRSFRRPVAT